MPFRLSAVHDCLHPDDPRPQPPLRPTDDDCCRGGCAPCVFDLYDEACERYRVALAAWEARQAAHEEHAHEAQQKTPRVKPRS
ncbi:oxidoreductase-like domain-containing protein [Paraburkholderia kururiensis]|uniref:oxidoreductase-like domain-containing protein n=1 Tax=Paraburkholderia kururiensis TaxID=984307 RepID=UPI0018F303A0|nr:oxidoreductase-like domain-containing protein [Paraburkholderia kururiensis]